MKHTISLSITILTVLIALIIYLFRLRSSRDHQDFQPANSRFNSALFILILLFGIAVRVYQFGDTPAGLFVDEAAIGYNVYALLHYGIDFNRFTNPINFISFGSGQHALYGYLSMPFIAIFGLNTVSIRLVSLLLGVLSLIIFYLLVRSIDDQTTALIAMFLLAINPWHIMMSRWGLDCNPFPAVFLLATYFLVKAINSNKFFPLSMVLYALTYYAYGTAYFVTTIFVLIICFYIYFNKKISLRTLGIGLVLFGLVALPIALYLAVNIFEWESIQLGWISIPRLPGEARYTQVSIFFNDGNLVKGLKYNISQLIHLLTTQKDRWIWNAMPQYGTTYLFTLPLILFGTILLLKEGVVKKIYQKKIMLIWLFLAILLGIVSPANVNRLNIIYIPVVYLIAKSLSFIRKQSNTLAAIIIVLHIAWFGLFVRDYFTNYAEQIGAAFNESLDEAIRFADDNYEGNIVVSTNHLHMPFIHVLFTLREDPREFLRTVEYVNPDGAFRNVSAYGRYQFLPLTQQPDADKAFVVENREIETFDLNEFDVTTYKYYSVLIPRE